MISYYLLQKSIPFLINILMVYLDRLIYRHKHFQDWLIELMKTTHDMSISCYQFISISTLDQLMKIDWLYFIFYYRNSLHIRTYMIVNA
jgi:hypothetical protein